VAEEGFDWSRLDITLARDPHRAVILSEVLTRDQLVSAFRRFQRLQVRKNLRALPFHPYRIKIPELMLGTLKDLGRLSFRLPRGGA